MTRNDIHEAAKNDDEQGQKPSEGAAASEGGSGFGTDSGTSVNGADAVPDATTGASDSPLQQPEN